MQIIRTKYFPATNNRSERIKASTDNYAIKQSSIICNYDNRLTCEKNHIKAARLLKDKMEWNGEWFGGHSKEGMIFVNKVIEYGL